jgi:ribosomal protein S18 acetylase RimI-like enzyme
VDVRNFFMHSIKTLTEENKRALLDLISRIKNFNKMDKDTAIELIEHFLEGKDDEYIIDCLFYEAKLAGYVCYGEASLTEGVYEIYYIAIDPDLQGKGMGKLLMQELEKKLSKNARMILIETSSDETYTTTQKFYERLDYKEIVRIKDFFKVGEDKIIYEKRLK